MSAVARRILLISVVLGLVAILAVVFSLLNGTAEKPRSQPDTSQVNLSVDTSAAWPIFRGNRNLQGLAQGQLADSLTLKWKFKTAGPIKSSPVISDGLVFVGSADGRIYAVELNTSQEVWTYQAEDSVEAPPCVVDGTVFTGSVDGFLYALHARDGSLKWKYQTGGKIHGSATWLTAKDSNGPRILAGSYDFSLHCVDAATGQALWTYQTENYVNCSIALADGKAILGGCDGRIHVVNTDDGCGHITIDAESYVAASAALRDGLAYLGTYEGLFLCADINTGQIPWKYEGAKQPILSSPAVGNDVVIFGARDNRLHCLNRKTGKPIWTFLSRGEIDSSPVICSGKVLVGSGDGRLYLLNLSDGKELWSYQIGAPIASSPAVVQGIVVIGCDDGYLYAFGPES